MTTKTSKTILFATIMAIGGTMIFGLVVYSADASEQIDYTELTIHKEPRGIEKFIASESAVRASTTTGDKILLVRGQTITIPVVIEHLSDTKTDAIFTVTPGFNSYMFTDTIMESTTPHERATAISEGKLPKGIIPYSDFITFEPSSVSLKSGESKQVMMTISINDKLSEISGVIGVNPHFTVSDKQNADKVGVFSFYVDVAIGDP